MENRKELIKKFRILVKKTGYRETYLAYAFLRKVPYAKLEKTINEDKFERQVFYRKCKMGVFSFLYTLASYVSSEIEKVENPEKSTSRYSTTNPFFNDVYNWMLEKYGPETDQKIEESAA